MQEQCGWAWETTKGKDGWEAHRGRWLWMVWCPGAFGGVCTTELLALSKIYPQLQQMECDVVAVSRDSLAAQLAWIYHIYENTGIEIPFALVSDVEGHLTKCCGVQCSGTIPYREALLIDPDGRCCAKICYPYQVGRNMQELLRLLQAAQMAQREGMEIPANWTEGIALVLPPPENYEELLERTMDRSGLCCMDWYLCFTDEGSRWKQRKTQHLTLT